MAEDFTIELRVYKSAGFSRDRMLALIEDLFIAAAENNECYVYSRKSKIFQQTVMEVTGVYRDPNPRPVVTPELRDALEFYLRNQKPCKYDDASETMYCYTHNVNH